MCNTQTPTFNVKVIKGYGIIRDMSSQTPFKGAGNTWRSKITDTFWDNNFII
jgi:hypothetical protein